MFNYIWIKRVFELAHNKTITLRKHAYSNILKILPPKSENFQIKKSDIFHVSAQNIDCGYSLELPQRGSSNKYPQFMFWAEIRKIMYTSCKPQFYYIKVGFKGVKIIQACFCDEKWHVRPREDLDQPGHPPSLISLCCLHEESLSPLLPIKCTKKTDLPSLIWTFDIAHALLLVWSCTG